MVVRGDALALAGGHMRFQLGDEPSASRSSDYAYPLNVVFDLRVLGGMFDGELGEGGYCTLSLLLSIIYTVHLLFPLRLRCILT